MVAAESEIDGPYLTKASPFLPIRSRSDGSPQPRLNRYPLSNRHPSLENRRPEASPPPFNIDTRQRRRPTHGGAITGATRPGASAPQTHTQAVQCDAGNKVNRNGEDSP